MYEKMPTASFPDSMMSLALSPASCTNQLTVKMQPPTRCPKACSLVPMNLFPITLSVNGQHVANHPPIQPNVSRTATNKEY